MTASVSDIFFENVARQLFAEACAGWKQIKVHSGCADKLPLTDKRTHGFISVASKHSC